MAGLAALRRHFPDRIPDGFAVTINAYLQFIEENRLMDKIRLLLSDLGDVTDIHQFQTRTATIREIINSATVPDRILQAIHDQAVKTRGQGNGRWAVRSSALSEDEQFSFAGQFDSRLEVALEDLGEAYRSVLAGRFTDRAIHYRLHCGIREVDTPMAVLFFTDDRAKGRRCCLYEGPTKSGFGQHGGFRRRRAGGSHGTGRAARGCLLSFPQCKYING